MYSKLSKMARDVLIVPATGADVEREFSISGRIVMKVSRNGRISCDGND
jgi:hypothetical protein